MNDQSDFYRERAMTNKRDRQPSDPKWSTGAKVGAAVGSAALVAALLYAGRRSLTKKKGKLEPQSPEPKTKPGPLRQPKNSTD